jgi:cysteine desulfurase
MSGRIYFDNSATTPVDPRVREAMKPFLAGTFGNPSSLHIEGRQAREAVEQARDQVARLVGATPDEIVFTGSGTEADNLALIGALSVEGQPTGHVVVSAIEHPAVLATCRHLERLGVAVTEVSPDADGVVDPSTVAMAIRSNTRLVSVMAANNVVGTLQPVSLIGALARDHGVLFHTDAVQAAGKITLDVAAMSIDLLSLSAHKLHGPKGVGALFVRKGVALGPIVHGGGQERGLRSATENVAGIVGFGRAAEIAREEMAEEAARLVALRERIVETLATTVPNAHLIGHRHKRLPGHVCLSIAGYEGEAIKLLLHLDRAGIAISTGSACSAHHAGEPSSILLAMGFDPIRARGSLRITLGRFNTDIEVDRFLEVLPRAVATMRPLTHRAQLERSLS